MLETSPLEHRVSSLLSTDYPFLVLLVLDPPALVLETRVLEVLTRPVTVPRPKQENSYDLVDRPASLVSPCLCRQAHLLQQVTGVLSAPSY